jgi:hypothetical protein
MWQEMVKATEATKKSADVAAAATKPWITTTTSKFIGIENSQFKINIGLKNVGQTAAVNVKAGFGFALIKRTPSRPRMAKQNCPPVKEAPGIVMPNVEWDNDVRSQIFTEYDFKSFKDGATVLYIIGCVEYEDVLGNKDRITKFARFYPSFFGEGFTIDPDNTQIR